MSQEIFEIVKQMNLDNLEVQIALQCAPLISGLRFSNLFNVNNEQADYLISLMNEMHISWKILFRGKEKLTMLLYKKDILENYFSDIRVKNILKNSGYEKNIVDEEDISGLIDTFADRYCCYMQTKKYFPHEMGLFLGYPVEDVEGYLKTMVRTVFIQDIGKCMRMLRQNHRFLKDLRKQKSRLYGFLLRE